MLRFLCCFVMRTLSPLVFAVEKAEQKAKAEISVRICFLMKSNRFDVKQPHTVGLCDWMA